jgi:1,4-alpha-glucan branching enzyme
MAGAAISECRVQRAYAIASPEAIRALAATYLLLPQTPMIFMGEASTIATGICSWSSPSASAPPPPE